METINYLFKKRGNIMYNEKLAKFHIETNLINKAIEWLLADTLEKLKGIEHVIDGMEEGLSACCETPYVRNWWNKWVEINEDLIDILAPFYDDCMAINMKEFVTQLYQWYWERLEAMDFERDSLKDFVNQIEKIALKNIK